MQALPVDRQKKHVPVAGSTRSTRRALAAAFASFNQTAGALETTYTKLQAEVGRLRHELESKNRSLAQSLEENQRMRSYLASIVEGLPCGVLVFDSEMNLCMINPAASRLLDAGGEAFPAPETSLPLLLEPLIAALPKENLSQEQEWVVEGAHVERTIGVTRACIPGKDRATTPFLSCAT